MTPHGPVLPSPARRAWLRTAVLAGLQHGRVLASTAASATPAARLALGAVGGIGAFSATAWPGVAHAHDNLGPLSPPILPPLLPLRLHDGRDTHLPSLLQGRITAVQLMFTGCGATCPIQGAVFAELQRVLISTGAMPAAQLLSVSVDPLSDDSAALAAWRRRFGAGNRWWAAAPPVRHAQALPDFFSGGRRAAFANGDRHSSQVYLFDTLGRLAFRMAELASSNSIATAMQQLGARSR